MSEEAKRAFASVAFPRIVEAENRKRDCDDPRETEEQSIVRMTLDYISVGLMDWDSATLFLKAIFDQVDDPEALQ